MKTPRSLLPDAPTLASRLAAGLGHGPAAQPLTILERKLPFMMSTSPNEVVTCRWPNGRKQRVFIKYEGNRNNHAFGHRGGIGYEARIYRRLLQALPDFRPQFLGAHTERQTGQTWLLLEYVDRAKRVKDIGLEQQKGPTAPLVAAARWIGKFHATQQKRAGGGKLSFAHRYDKAYYRGWARRTLEYAQPLLRKFPWLTEVAEWGDSWFAPLLAVRPTVIHGEFYPKTVLLRRNRLYCVDWESAAVAAGEIDLAALTEGKGWPRRLIQQTERAYQDARWPEGAPPEFQLVLDSARVYLQFRWLGERPERTTDRNILWRFHELHRLAKELKLL